MSLKYGNKLPSKEQNKMNEEKITSLRGQEDSIRQSNINITQLNTDVQDATEENKKGSK